MSVIIKKNGFFFKDAKNKKIKLTEPEALLDCWRQEIDVENTTLKSLLLNLIELGGNAVYLIECLTRSKILENIPDFNKRYKKDPDIDHIEVSKCFEIMDLGKYNEPPNVEEWLEQSIHCSGISKKLNKDGKPELYGLEFLNWGELLHLPIVVSNEAELWIDGHKRGKGLVPKLYGKYNINITFGEFMNAIFDELSFFGTPENRDKELVKLNKAVKDIDEGKVKLIPWEEVKAELGKIK